MNLKESPEYRRARAAYLSMDDEAFEELLADDDGSLLDHFRAELEAEETALAEHNESSHVGPGLLRGDAIRRYIEAGNAYFTIRNSETGNRFTYRVNAPKGRRGDAAILFVSVLSDADNNSGYRYIGFVRDGRFFHGGGKSFAGREAPSVVAFGWTWSRVAVARPLPASVEVWHQGKCGRCGRKLTVPESIENGIGPECARRAS